MKKQNQGTRKMDVKDKSVRNSRDTLFRYIFSQAEALKQLYSFASGNDLPVEEITPIDLTDLLQRKNRYNDVAFAALRQRLIVLTEHQSTKNGNMPYRMMEYLVDLARSTRAIGLDYPNYRSNHEYPKVEFYVAYNGKAPLKEDEKKLVIDMGAIRLEATVVDIRWPILNNPEDGENPAASEGMAETLDRLIGYSFFVNEFEAGLAKEYTPYKAYHYAVKRSQEEGHLLDIWNNEELVDMFEEVFCYDKELIKEGRAEGREEGLAEGLEKKAKEVALKLLKKGLALEDVADAVGEPISWVMALA